MRGGAENYPLLAVCLFSLLNIDSYERDRGEGNKEEEEEVKEKERKGRKEECVCARASPPPLLRAYLLCCAVCVCRSRLLSLSYKGEEKGVCYVCGRGGCVVP